MTDAARLTAGVMVLAMLRERDAPVRDDPAHAAASRRPHRAADNGTMYHTVGRLERCSLLTEVGVDRDGNRPERTACMTDAGERAIVGPKVRRELPVLGHPSSTASRSPRPHNLDRDGTVAAAPPTFEALDDSLEMHRKGLAKARATGIVEQYLIGRPRTRAARRPRLALGVHRSTRPPDFVWGTQV
ncbi:MAG: PadR family transcriptional regulator [Microbacterium sp.]